MVLDGWHWLLAFDGAVALSNVHQCHSLCWAVLLTTPLNILFNAFMMAVVPEAATS